MEDTARMFQSKLNVATLRNTTNWVRLVFATRSTLCVDNDNCIKYHEFHFVQVGIVQCSIHVCNIIIMADYYHWRIIFGISFFFHIIFYSGHCKPQRKTLSNFHNLLRWGHWNSVAIANDKLFKIGLFSFVTMYGYAKGSVAVFARNAFRLIKTTAKFQTTTISETKIKPRKYYFHLTVPNSIFQQNSYYLWLCVWKT